MNKWLGMGRLVRDPEVRYTEGAEPKAVAKFTLAVDRRFKRDGEQSADFIQCTAFGKIGEFVEHYLVKGTKVVVEGKWQTGSYDNKDGQKVYTNTCIVDSIEFAESKKANNEEQSNEQSNGDFVNVPDNIDEMLPF